MRADRAQTGLHPAGKSSLTIIPSAGNGVISDIVMAGEMDGIELARTIRRDHPRLPILLVTGYAGRLIAAEFGFAVLPKPFRLADLNRSVSRAIDEADVPTASNVVRLHAPRRAESGSAD
jgi:CheY-like chemotaxis protein